MADAWFDDESVERLCDEIEAQLLILENDYKNNEYADETQLSSDFTTRIRVAVEGFSLRYVPQYTYFRKAPAERFAQLKAKEYGLMGRSLTHGNEFSEEVKYGADILLVFQAEVEGETRKKGMMIQSKDNKGSKFGFTSRPDLSEQCAKMARVTDSSYVLVFASNGFHLGLNPVVLDPRLPFRFHAPPAGSLREVFKAFLNVRVETLASPQLRKASLI